MKDLVSTLSICLFFAGMHLAVMYGLLTDKNLSLLLGIHLFLSTFLVVGQLILKKIKSIDKTKVGMAFLAITVGKMLFSLIFILLIYYLTDTPRLVLIGNFFAAYFAYLIYEVLMALKEVRNL